MIMIVIVMMTIYHYLDYLVQYDVDGIGCNAFIVMTNIYLFIYLSYVYILIYLLCISVEMVLLSS